jgi:GDP-L-fucose synthase
MTVLVTGSNGLVGNALKKLLGDNHIYHTRKDADLTNEIITKEYITYHVKNSDVDTIIHCAAMVGGVQANSINNETFFIENYKINNNVISSAFENKIKNFVNLSSTCIFPDSNITYPLTADQIDIAPPHSSNYGYSYAKRLSGYQTKIIRQLTGNNWITIVPTNVYGPYDNFHPSYSHLIPGIIHRAYDSKVNNEDFVVWGDGSPLRQFIHSKDLAKNIMWAITNWNSDVPFMAVNDNEHSVMDVVKIVIKKFGIEESRLIFDDTMPKGQFRKPAKSDIPKDYNYIDLETGVNETIDWFNNNYNTLRK